MASLPSESVAAVDLGSNSFHMTVAQVSEGRLQVIDRMREMVRLAAGLDDGNVLSEPVTARAIECLRRFGQRLRGTPPANVRAVGTNTLRKARNRVAFLAAAEQALGHRIDVIAGREEARLIYLGVSHSLEDGAERRLVVDIGGGSTELILGHRASTLEASARRLGTQASRTRPGARLHEIGLAISHSHYHKHGGYLVRHLDMPGFSQGEQNLLAVLILAHRRRFPLAEIKTLSDHMMKPALYLCVLLRLSVVLHRSQTDTPLSPITLEGEAALVKLRFPEGWLDEHPLTRADLEQEADYLKAVDFKLRFK